MFLQYYESFAEHIDCRIIPVSYVEIFFTSRKVTGVWF
jgi:hypothetical protein